MSATGEEAGLSEPLLLRETEMLLDTLSKSP
jgi:hypothetical protein